MLERATFTHLRAAYFRLVQWGGLDRCYMSRRVWHAAIMDAIEASELPEPPAH